MLWSGELQQLVLGLHSLLGTHSEPIEQTVNWCFILKRHVNTGINLSELDKEPRMFPSLWT